MKSELLIGFFWVKDDTRDIWGLVSDGDINKSKANIYKDGEYFDIKYNGFSLSGIRIKGSLEQAQLKAETDILSRLVDIK